MMTRPEPAVATRQASWPPPAPAEAAALRQAGDYLVRAGSASARALFAAGATPEAAALATLSDQFLAAARLCAAVLATVQGAGHSSGLFERPGVSHESTMIDGAA